MNPEFVIRLDAETLGRLFMPRATTFEVLSASIVQEQFVIDTIDIVSEQGRCRLVYSEWEEGEGDDKSWVSEYAIELNMGGMLAYGTYGATFPPQQRAASMIMNQIKREAEEDFILVAKLIGRSVRRDLVVDEDAPERLSPGPHLH